MTRKNDGSPGATEEPSSHHEYHTLADGESVLLRPVTPRDRHDVAVAFEHLSPGSRYTRFFSPRRTISDRELDLFSSADGKHLALGVQIEESGKPVAIAHIFRSDEDPNEAEMAMTVADEHQGRGIGELLFRRLIAAAIERDISIFHCEVLYENIHMRHLVRRIARDATSTTSRGVTTYRMPLHKDQTLMPTTSRPVGDTDNEAAE